MIWNKLRQVISDPFSFRAFASDIRGRLDALKTEIEQVREYSATYLPSLESFAVGVRDQQYKLLTELEKVKELAAAYPHALEEFASGISDQQYELLTELEKVKELTAAYPHALEEFASGISGQQYELLTEFEKVKELTAAYPHSLEEFASGISGQQSNLLTELEKVKGLSLSSLGFFESFAADVKGQQHRLQTVLDGMKTHLPEYGLSLEAFSTNIIKRQERLQNDVEFVKNHMASYLGNGTGLTHLIDETPIYINTNDFGCPANFINGGRYEEDYFAVLASFRKPDSVFLDIGSNLGVFSLRMAPLVRHGKIHAFEPNNAIRELFARSIHLNGIKPQINLYGVGVSDSDGKLALSVPEGHAGGGSLTVLGGEGAAVGVEVRRLDSLLPDVSFDIAKIDVEGHELQALRGMTDMLRRSGNAVVLFEKLNANSGIEADLMDLFSVLGMSIYRIDGVTLTPVDLSQFSASEAYFLAARPSVVGDELTRNFITLYPNDLFSIAAAVSGDELTFSVSSPEPGALLFHGPYWYLPRGSYSITVDGEIEGEFSLALAEKFGYRVDEFVVSSQTRSFNVVVERDLTHFEVVGRALSGRLAFSLNSIRFTRLG